MQAIMTDLKTHLYAKFGDAINLEADDWYIWNWFQFISFLNVLLCDNEMLTLQSSSNKMFCITKTLYHMGSDYRNHN